MPELPEVEVIRRDLFPQVVGRTIESAEVTAARLTRRRGSPPGLEAALAGRTVRCLRRRGKYLLLDLTGDETLAVRLGMTGQLRWSEDGAGYRPDAHTHARLVFAPPPGAAGGPGARGGLLYYRDVRKFGELFLVPSGEVDRLLPLGPEPLDPGLRAEDLLRLCRSGARIKSVLLDQRKLAGVGNIYADEALFRAGIRPTRRARTLTRAGAARLLKALRAVLRAGIRHRGSSISDYRDASGAPGRFARLHRVYHRHGRPCRACGTPIRRVRIGQRSAHFCPSCQR